MCKRINFLIQDNFSMNWSTICAQTHGHGHCGRGFSPVPHPCPWMPTTVAIVARFVAAPVVVELVHRLRRRPNARVLSSKAREQDSSNPVFGFSMVEQVRLFCCLAHGELARLFLEPDTGLDICPSILLSCFRARTSAPTPATPARPPRSSRSRPANRPPHFLVFLIWRLAIGQRIKVASEVACTN